MKKNLLRSALLALMVLVGGNAWAADKTVVKYSFDDAMSPSLNAGNRVSLDYGKTSVITSTTFLNAWNNTNGDPAATTVSLGNTDLSGETWTLSFEWAACGGCNSKADHTTLKAGDTNLFDLTGNSNWNTTVTITYAGSDGTKTLPVPGCDKGKRFTAGTGDQYNTVTYWHHIVVTGSASGVKMTITNSSTGTAVVEDVLLSETNVNPTSLIIEPCCGGAIGIDELSLTYFVEGEVIQTPTANYTAVNGIERTITATCDTEGATLYYSTDSENWTEGASITVSASGNVYFKAVKGNSESDVLTFAAVAGEAVTLNAPTIVRSDNTTVTISADQTNLLLSPTATIKYTYGNEAGEFTGSKTLTVAADATITAYAEATGYTNSTTSERAVALFPEYVNSGLNTPTKTSGTSSFALSTETITVSEREYAALLLDGVQWGTNVYLQNLSINDPIVWGIRNGNWYINTTDPQWILIRNLKAGDIVVVDVTYPAADMVNATYSEKLSFGTKYAYIVNADGDVELDLRKINAKEMNYFYGVYSYSPMSDEEVAAIKALQDAKDALQTAINEAKAIETEGKEGVEALNTAISTAEEALSAEDATVESLTNAKNALAEAVAAFEEANAADPNDYTSYIVNADLTGEGGFDATGTKGIDGSGIVKAANNAQFDFKQTIATLPAGQYKLTAKAAYRYSGSEADEAAAINAGTETKFATLYATTAKKTVSAKVQNRWDGASDTDYANGDGSVTVNEKYVPNSSNAVKAWFTAGQYVNEVVFNLPEDGDVTIGIVKTAQPEAGDYTVIGPWTLTRLGDAEAEPEPVVPELANADFEGEYTVFASPSGDRDILQPAGWTITYENGDANDMTALNSNDKAWNNFSGRPQLGEAGGNNTYWVRFRWGNSETLTLSQEVTLAAGTYKLSADAFFNGANGAAATISAAGQSAAITGNGKWANHKVVFNVAEESTVTIALNVTQTQAVENVAAFDNVTLEAYVPLDGAKDELQAAITDAKAIETEGKTGVDELNAAIADAEAALNAADATVESLNAAKDALIAAVAEFNDVNITVPALAGWTRVRTANIENVADNYYVLVDANSLNYVMANEADHYRPCYRTVADPVANPSFAWTLEGSDNTFALKSFSTGSYFVQADGWNTSMTGSTGSATFQFTLNDGVYSIKCVQSNALVGHWNDSGAAVANDGESIAANKQAKDAPGFYLFAMPKATYEAAILAVRAEETAGASKENGIDVTAWIQNADWSGDFGGWARSGSWGNMQWGQQTLEVWNASNVVMKQTLTAVPDGTYKLTADVISGNGDNKVAFVYGTGGATVKSDAVTAEASAGNYNTMSAEVAGNTLTADNIVVTGGVLTVGLDIAAGWIVADNFKLYYYGEDMSQYAQAYHDALTAAQAIDTTAPMNGDVLSALNTALTTYASVDETDKATLLAATTALGNATEAATASIAAYATAADILPKMKQLTEETNVYTAEALASYYTQWADKYEARTLTNDEANALQDPYAQTGWQHDANMKVDDLLLSAWSFGDVKAKDYETALYINTWSTEGNNDGSEFRVPFFEYWTGDGESLGEKTLTATMTALAAGTYNVTAWVRVRIKNGAEAPAAGITLQVNEGEAVNVTGDQVGESQMYLKEVAATGIVAEDGELNIKFSVAADNNISWLSFKNVKFVKDPATGIKEIEDARLNIEGTVFNLSGQKVEKAQKGLYIVNGKKMVVK